MLNKCQIIGNLGADPDMRYVASGDAVTTFSVAVNERWKNRDGEQQERTEWFRVVVWRGLAETCAQYLQKGRQVYVEGRLQTRSWEDKSGSKQYRTEVIADRVQFLSGRQPDAGESAPGIDPDELPF